MSRLKLMLALTALMLVLLLLVQLAPGVALPESALRAQAFVRLVFAVLVLAATIVLNPRLLAPAPSPAWESLHSQPTERPLVRSCVRRC